MYWQLDSGEVRDILDYSHKGNQNEEGSSSSEPAEIEMREEIENCVQAVNGPTQK